MPPVPRGCCFTFRRKGFCPQIVSWANLYMIIYYVKQHNISMEIFVWIECKAINICTMFCGCYKSCNRLKIIELNQFSLFVARAPKPILCIHPAEITIVNATVERVAHCILSQPDGKVRSSINCISVASTFFHHIFPPQVYVNFLFSHLFLTKCHKKSNSQSK